VLRNSISQEYSAFGIRTVVLFDSTFVDSIRQLRNAPEEYLVVFIIRVWAVARVGIPGQPFLILTEVVAGSRKNRPPEETNVPI